MQQDAKEISIHFTKWDYSAADEPIWDADRRWKSIIILAGASRIASQSRLQFDSGPKELPGLA